MILGDVLARRLAELGVRRIWGEPIPVTHTGRSAGDAGGRPDAPQALTLPAHVPVPEADLAVLLADADGRIGEVDGHGRLGAALLPDGVLHLSSRPGGTAAPRTVTSAEELLDALVEPPGLLTPATSAIHLDVDLAMELDDEPVPTVAAERQTVFTLDPSLADLRIVVVVGPGVVRAGGVGGLKSLSRAAAAGVINTWGAKGIERWDSPWHFGTIGLQRRDVELGGVPDADVVIVSGLDPVELSMADLGHPVIQEVHPGQLGALCGRWDSPGGEPAGRPALYQVISEVVRPLYEDAGAPLSGPRAALHLSGALPEGGMAVVDPGLAGFWAARTFPTSIPNSLCVPAAQSTTEAAGFAAAAALVCRMEDRPVLAVTDDAGFDAPETAAVLAFAESTGASVALQVWRDEPGGDGGRFGSADAHVELLREHLGATTVRVDDVPVRLGGTEAFEAAAGPIHAWGRSE